MLDPFPVACPKLLADLVKPIEERLNLSTLHLHIHEVIFAFILYHVLCHYVSPRLSRFLVPQFYNSFNARTRLNWNVHVVSLFQSVLISSLSIYVSFYDNERNSMDWRERIWGYTGATGLVVALTVGYFLWDLYISTRYISIFGAGLLAHAVSALCVYALGFRPFVNYYAPGFILFELSSPFLNFHWFFDKVNMTGSNAQLVNGILLMSTFFGSRIVWGNLLSYRVFSDMWQARQYQDTSSGALWLETVSSKAAANLTSAVHGGASAEVMRYAQGKYVPGWMALVYLTSNLVLAVLNIHWFGKMIETIRKRFPPPLGTKEVESEPNKAEVVMGRSIYEDNHKSVELTSKQTRKRRAA